MNKRRQPKGETMEAANLEKLSKEELLVLLRAKEITARLSGITPPVEDPKPKGRKKAIEPTDKPRTDWSKVIHTCPKCERTGPVDPLFGIRKVRGKELKQSYCSNCRATTNYHAKPRTYNKAGV